MPVTLFKLGGSLLNLPELGDRLSELLDSRTDERPLIVVGGGAACDIVREWDRVHGLGAEQAHLLALRAMELNEAFFVGLVARGELVGDRCEADRVWNAGGIPVIAARRFLADEEPHAELPLPHDWSATSDSIAAWIAIRWPADRLVLIKSVERPAVDVNSTDAIAEIDACFATLAAQLSAIGWVNLRRSRPRIETFELPRPPAAQS